MECPYCHGKLVEGRISEIGTGTNGAPAFMSRIFYSSEVKKEGLNVGHFQKAYYCEHCHKVFGELSAE